MTYALDPINNMIGNNYFSLFSNNMGFSDAQIALPKWQPFNYNLKANILTLAQT